jgi:hypothetical protein
VTVTEFIHPGLAGGDRRSIRWQLFLFSDVRDLLPTTRPDAVVVVHEGPARVGQWTEPLAAAGRLRWGEPAPPAA